MTTAHDFSVTLMNGETKSLKDFAGQAVLVVNVASRCGYTKQYKGLEALWREMKDAGLVVVGVPCNQFGAQEPGSEAEIKQFCSLKYEVTFPMFSKVKVKGADKAPVFEALTKAAGGEVKWNFTKFLVGKNGDVVARFESDVDPMSPKMVSAVEQAIRA